MCESVLDSVGYVDVHTVHVSAFEYIYLPFIGRPVDFLLCLCFVVAKYFQNTEELGLQFSTIATLFNVCLATLFCTKSYLTVSPESFDLCLLEHFFPIIPVLFRCLKKCFKIKFLRNLICDDFMFSLHTNCLIICLLATLLGCRIAHNHNGIHPLNCI